jgi:hypothetical protein
MGFDPQTANLPLINVHKRTTKVNLFMAGAVVFFLLVGVAVILWATHRAKDDTPASPPVELRH